MHRLIEYHKIQVPNSRVPAYVRSILPDTRFSQTGRRLRNSQNLTQPNNRTSLFKHSFIPQTTKEWNALPQSLKHLNQPSFKKELSKYFGQSPAPKYFSYGSKLENIVHTQLRVGTSKLKAHMYKLQLNDSPDCPCGEATETSKHLVLDSSLHVLARHLLRAARHRFCG